jgi:hypothetical protein
MLEYRSIEGERPVAEICTQPWMMYPSIAGLVEPCEKLGGPPSKTKYYRVTDSGLVP